VRRNHDMPTADRTLDEKADLHSYTFKEDRHKNYGVAVYGVNVEQGVRVSLPGCFAPRRFPCLKGGSSDRPPEQPAPHWALPETGGMDCPARSDP